MRRFAGVATLVIGLIALTITLILLRFAQVTDFMYHRLVKDPERHPPAGRVIVAPADGRVIYVRHVTGGVIPEIVKRGVQVPLADHLKFKISEPFPDGTLVGIFMAWNGVHVNRVPIAGKVRRRIVFNGPHMDMSPTERTVILTQLIPGWVSVKKFLGMPPYNLDDKADYILKSARETLVIRDIRSTDVYVVRIADFVVGKILTWIRKGELVRTGQKLGMIALGSQTDLFFEDTPGITLKVEVGQYVYAGETVLATY